jgi:siroheme decarboxylase
MTSLQQRLGNLLQRGLDICERPFQQMAERLASTESEVIEAACQLRDQAILRRIGPIIDPRALGKAATLVTSHVPDPPLRQVIEAVNSLEGVSHNYLRRHHYNLWFTLQATSPGEIHEILDKLGRAWGIELHSLSSRRTFKLEVYFDATGQEPPGLLHSEPSQAGPVRLSSAERLVLADLQKGLDIQARPFDHLARHVGSVAKVIQTIDSLIKKGAVRRIAGVLNHRTLGFTANIMLAAEVAPELIEPVGLALSRLSQVSHCYQRDSFAGWPYTLYAMLHGRSATELHDLADAFCGSNHVRNVVLLETIEELKKRPVIHALT